MPSARPPLRVFLNETYPGPTGRTRRNRFEALRGLYRYAVSPLRRCREIPDAVPYDLRDSFATLIGRAVRAGGGRTSEAQDVARRPLGHGEGGDVRTRYRDDDDRDEELDLFGPPLRGGERGCVPESGGWGGGDKGTRTLPTA